MKKALVLLLMLSTGNAIAQLSCRSQPAIKNNGQTLSAIPFAQITVCSALATGSPCSPLVPANQLFQDAAGTVPITSNPFSADLNGNYTWCVSPGTYVEQVSAGGVISYTTSNVTLGATNISIPVSIAQGGTGTSVPGSQTGALCYFTPTSIFCDSNSLTDGLGHLNILTMNANQFTIAGAGAGTITFGQGTSVPNPSAGKAAVWVDSVSNQLSCILSSGVTCLTASGGGTPGGSNQQLQFNDNGVFGGASTLLWNKATSVLTVPGGTTISSLAANTTDVLFPAAGSWIYSDNSGNTGPFIQITGTTSGNPSLLLGASDAGNTKGSALNMLAVSQTYMGHTFSNGLAFLADVGSHHGIAVDGSTGQQYVDKLNVLGNSGSFFDASLVATANGTKPMQVVAGATTTSNGALAYDSTAGHVHTAIGGVDKIVCTSAGDPGCAAGTPTQLAENVTSVNNAASPYTVIGTDAVILCDASGGAVTINLPAASATKREITVKKTDTSANICTVARNGADLIDGQTSILVSTQYIVVKIQDSSAAVWSRLMTYQYPLLGHGNQSTVGASSTNFVPLSYGSSTNATETIRGVGFPAAGMLTNLCITTTGAQSGTGALVLTVRDTTAASDSSLVVTFAAGQAATTLCDNVDIVAIVAHHTYTLKVANAATAASAAVNAVTSYYSY